MILVKKLTSTQVIETITALAMETLPEEAEGELVAQYDEEGGIEIMFLEAKSTRGTS